MAYVWRALEPDAEVPVMTYAEALSVAEEMGFTKSESWKTGARSGKPGYVVTAMAVGSRLFRRS
jgi:hypothetical protein